MKIKKIKCQRCGYSWYSKTESKRVSCPKCGYSTLNPYFAIENLEVKE